jgi:two-component system, cell cycle sensor histidine kinase and response regulator CckA
MKTTILIVDDNELNLYQLQVLLAGNGYDLVSATNGAEALAIARQSPPNLIITDILMPVMDGFTLCREWMQDERLRPIPLIFYTASYTQAEDEEFAKNLGAVRFLIKPEEPEIILRNVQEALQQAQNPSTELPQTKRASHTQTAIEHPSEEEESHYLKQYNEVLIRKLQDKMQELSQANRNLELDIAQRKQAEEALHNSEIRYHMLFEHSPEGILIIDPETGRFLEFNEIAHRQLGYSREEFARLSITDVDVTESPDSVKLFMAKIPREGRIDFETLHRTKQGEIRNIQVTAQSTEIQGQTIYHSVWRDITERKRSEADRERLKMAIDHADEIVIITDSEGKIQYVNPAFEAVTGYAREEVLEQTPKILKSGLQEESFYHQLWETITSGQTWKGRFINKRKDGSTYTEAATISVVHNPEGKIINFVAVKRDITNHLLLEKQFRQAQKMESVGRLAGGVAHDFNNMIGVILGYAGMALERVNADDPLHAELGEIISAAKRSADITRQLLAFARKQTIAPTVLDLNGIVAGMLKMLHRLIGENIELNWKPKTDLWLIRMDPSQIDQILANLCVNARDAIQDVGKVVIETRNAVFDVAYCANHAGSVPGEYVLLSVSDDGCGMSEEILHQIFEPFFTTKEASRGTGLGLATVYGIVKQNNGFIYVDSRPNSGTTFQIFFPRHTGSAIAMKDSALEQSLNSRGETLLLVEDEPNLLSMTIAMLEGAGYVVIAANAPEEALRLAEQHEGEIHLMITDVVMPNMNGFDLAKRLQTIRPTMKCLFVSGYSAGVFSNHRTLDEDAQILQKPFSKKELTAKAREVLDHGIAKK